MQFGLGMPIVQQVPSRAQAWEREGGAEELTRMAEAADRLGFAWITCSDHVAVPASYAEAMGPTWYEPVATLGFLAAKTDRVRLLSHVMVLPYRHPLLTAKSFATLDRLSGGRVILGVGVGHCKPEFRSLGLAYERRGRETDEALRAVCAALEQGVSRFEGEFNGWRDMMISPRPVQLPRPPIWIGGNGRAAVRRAAEIGEGWIPWELEPEEFRAMAKLAREGAQQVDRSAPELIAPLAVAYGDDAAVVRSRIETWRAAGATAFHVGIGHRSLAEFLDRAAWFAAEIRAQDS